MWKPGQACAVRSMDNAAMAKQSDPPGPEELERRIRGEAQLPVGATPTANATSPTYASPIRMSTRTTGNPERGIRGTAPSLRSREALLAAGQGLILLTCATVLRSQAR